MRYAWWLMLFLFIVALVYIGSIIYFMRTLQ
jgi:5-methylcytosine-specific restriction enzyme A